MFPINPFPITVTALYASLLAILLLVLAVFVGLLRVRRDTLLGDDGSSAFRAAVQAHTNFVEYVPIAILLLLIAELNGVHGLFLHAVGALFTLGRIGHAFGIIRAQGELHAARFAGTVLSWLCIAVLAGTNLLYATHILQ